MGSTSTTLAGLMESVPAYATAIFRTQSSLYNSVLTEQANGLLTVNFTYQSVPNSSSVITEGSEISDTAFTVGTRAATIQAHGVKTFVSDVALGGGSNVAQTLGNTLGGAVARDVDTSIITLFSEFSQSVGTGSADFSKTYFLDASAKLDESGYYGQKIAVLHPQQAAELYDDLTAVATDKANMVYTNGYLGQLGGVIIYQSPWVKFDATNTFYGAMFVKEAAIGLGYRLPIIDIEFQRKASYLGYDVVGSSFFKTVGLNWNAGCIIYSKRTT